MPSVPAIPIAVLIGEHHLANRERELNRRRNVTGPAVDANPPTPVGIAIMPPVVIGAAIMRAIPAPIVGMTPAMPSVATIPIAVLIGEHHIAGIDGNAETGAR